MGYREFHYRWEYELESSPEMLWPLVADTNRFNRDAGMPSVRDAPPSNGARKSDGAETKQRAAWRRLHLSMFGFKVAWDEEPFEWTRPHRFGVVRHYTHGPLERMRVTVELAPRDGGGTRLVYQLWVMPRTALGAVAIPWQVGARSARKFAKVIRRYDRLAQQGQTTALPLAAPSQLTDGGRVRLSLLSERLIKEGASPELVAHLAETIEHSDDLSLARIRPYALADYWQTPRRAALELCLTATRAGLLDLRWDLLCPLCRGANESSTTLREMPTEAHCASCNIDFTANFDRSVEVTFRPNPAVRQIEVREFCVGGPQVTPHIAAQLRVAPGETRTLTPALEEGRYRLRAMNVAGGQFLLVAPDGDKQATLQVNSMSWPEDERRLSPTPSLSFENATDDMQLLILERTAWGDQAATAADVTALQLFRDLFASEALRPGDRISVGSMTILFTDLRGSTRLYRDIGDAVAFGAVMNHFDVLRDAIADEGGALVKTIGDAVMAVFRRPASALRAIVRAQAALASPPANMRPLLLKAGIHSGACIAVTLNGRLDYFGSNVNIAARLEPLSTGADVVISSAVRHDPKVAAMLEDPEGELVAEPLETGLRGFDEERFELWRVMPKKKQMQNGEQEHSVRQ
ncbi:MAG TPA: DUF5939 domain-containing protein [Pyrinomonadaceae bacterium]|jgi:class 3 adenylate cyclase